MARTFTCNEEIIVVSKGTEDIGKLAMLGNGGKFDPSVIPEIQASIPAGVVLHFAAATPPKGWLKADGSAVSRNEYEDLFAIIGTTFGDGDGSTTFHLPDLRGEFIRGFDDGRGVDVISLTGNTTIASNKITNIAGPSNSNTPLDTSSLALGMAITGSGIPLGSTVVSIVDATTITISTAATTTTNGASLTFTRILGSVQRGSGLRGVASNSGKNGIANMWVNTEFDSLETFTNFYPASSTMDPITAVKGTIRPRNIELY